MKVFVVFSLILAVAFAYPFDVPQPDGEVHEEYQPSTVVEDENGEHYYLVPLGRTKRQTTNWQIQSPGIASLSHKGTILDNPNHHPDGSGYVTKDLRGHGLAPDAYGGRVDYTHKPTGSNLGVGADHARGFGTDVTASGTYNFLHSKSGDLGVTGQYGRHFGGPGGTGRPNWGVFVGGKYRF
uniref:Hypothetical antimicrobial peptide n=1 Tax=Sitophilus zeamais TaxID=7047 RepID=B6RQP2_SITZE|nr:hypothetical antimicrobial peptide [Sitophilus zeamais]